MMKTYCVLGLLLILLLFSSCGKTGDLHYLKTTAATAEIAPATEAFIYTPSDNREPYGNPKNISKPLQVHDGYLYFMIGNGMDVPMELVRYNCESGNATAAPTAHAGNTPCTFCAYGAVCRAAQKAK